MSVTVPGCYLPDGTPATAAGVWEIRYPPQPEGPVQPTPAQGAKNVTNNLAQNTSPTQQPGLA